MITLDLVNRGAGWCVAVRFASASYITAKCVDQQFHRIALSVARRGFVCEDKKLHAGMKRVNILRLVSISAPIHRNQAKALRPVFHTFILKGRT